MSNKINSNSESRCPIHPTPYKKKASLMTIFSIKRKSWLDGLYERSYRMKMGQVNLPGTTLHVVNDPKQVRRVMIDEVRDFPKGEMLHELLCPLLGESIFTTNGEVWERQRNLLKPSFAMTSINRVFTRMNEAVLDMMVRFEQYADGEIVEVDEHMTFTTADVIFRTIMSAELEEAKGKAVIQAFDIYQEETTKTGIQKIFYVPKIITGLLGDKRRLRNGEIIRNTLADIIQPRYDAVSRGEVDDHEDILASLLQVVDSKTSERFSFKEILDQVAMLFLAGHETSASALTWSLYLLCFAQEEQKKAYEEVRRVVGDDEFTSKKVRELKHVTNIFKEALRLYPPVGFFVREAKIEKEMRGKQIKVGDAMVVAPWLIHRHEDYWDNPNEFDPSRHEIESSIVRENYLPFGMGERICIGSGFAMQEGVLILANILRKYHLELEAGFVPDIVGRLTIRSANGMNVRMTKR